MPSQTFTSSGTWSCPTNYLPGSLIVMCWGEGGTGGTSVHGSHGGGGGGGGEWAQDSPGVTAGNNYSVTVGAGSTGTNTTFVGDASSTVTAHAGGASPGQGGGTGGTGSTNASHFDGGTGGTGSLGSSVSGAGGGGSAGSGSAGGAGNSSGTGGTAGTGTNPGAVGGAGGTALVNGNNGNAPGSGGGGGGSGGSLNHSGGNGAAGQVIVFWQTFVPAPPPIQRRQVIIPAASLVKRRRPAVTPLPGAITLCPSAPLNANYDFETTISPWVAFPHGTVQQATIGAVSGSHSLEYTPDGVNSGGAWSESGIAVTPGTLITFSFTAISPQGWTGSGNGVQPIFWWTGGSVGSTPGPVTPLPAGVSTPVSFQAQVPAGATSVQVEMNIGNPAPATTLFYYDLATVTVLLPCGQYVSYTPRYPQHFPALIADVMRHTRQSPTGWDTGIQPKIPPTSEHARFKPPYPRRGVTITPWPSRNIPPTESERRRAKPPYPRKGVVAPTGWPVPVQPPRVPNVSAHRDDRTRRRRPQRGTMLWPGTPAVLVQPPWSSWVYKRRWTKPLFPRKGVVAPEALPPPPLFTPFNTESERRPQRYQWFRRGNVPPTGWPIPVQPPMTSQSLRRWYKPPWPRKGVQPPTNLPEPVPTSWVMRRPQKYQWFRKGRANPGSGLPVPVQPPEVPHSVKRIPLRALLPRKQGPKFSAFFIPVQPPERMQAIRRWSKPLWPRRGRTDIATFPGAQVVTGYQLLQLQTFTYTPGGAGLDLGTLGLTLFPLNKLGYTFWNRYGDVVFIVWNNTSLPIAVTPNVIRKVELQSVTLPQYTLQPGVMQAFGPYPPNDFADPQLATPAISYYMTVGIEANLSGVFAGAFRMVIAPPYGHTGPYDVIGLRLVRKIAEHHVHTSSTPGDIHPGETTPGA